MSFVENPVETAEFLARIRSEIASRRPVSIRLENVARLTVDAVAALVALARFARQRGVRYGGTYPTNESAQNLLVSVGFYDRFATDRPMPLERSGGVHRLAGTSVNAAEIDHVIRELTLLPESNPRAARASVNILLEATGNTFEHAPGQGATEGSQEWWLVVKRDEEENLVHFSLLDLGIGVVNSAKIRGFARAMRHLGLKSDGAVLESVLAGEVDSRTGRPYRGRGIEKIVSHAKRGTIAGLVVVANRGHCSVDRTAWSTKTLPIGFHGTLLHWVTTRS